MKQSFLKTMLLLCALMVGSSSVWATTYKLTKVTTISAGNKYVFERNSRVLKGYVSSSALQTTASYSKTGLTGTETYIWTLETATGGFYLKNNNQYLNNSSSTDIYLGSKSSIWSIAFSNEVALLSNTSNSNRFLGEATTNTYKAYDTSNLNNHGHDFTVYVLEEVEEIHVTGVTLTESSLSMVYGNTSSLDATIAPAEATNKAVTWSSSNENVATVNSSGVVTAHAVGKAIITVTTTDQGKTASCEVTVAPDTSKPFLVDNVFEETFANISGAVNSGFDNPGWTTSGSVARVTRNQNYAVKLAMADAGGSITTPVITGLGTTAKLSFKTMGFSSSEKSISIIGTNCTVSPASFDDLSSSTYTEKNVTITGIDNNSKITFSTVKNMRVYIDDIIITPKATVDVKLSATGYASYCSPFALDLTPTEDYTAWIVTGTSGTTVTFEKILGKVAAGTPFIIYNSAKAGDTVELPIIDDDDTGIAAVAGNMLQGTLSPTYVSTVDGDYTNFGLSNGSFLKINNGVMKANKAYLPILTSNLPSGVRLNIVFEEEITGVAEVRSQMEEVRGTVYNLNGQKVVKPGKGMYIMNGKKVIFK